MASELASVLRDEFGSVATGKKEAKHKKAAA
jgi:hypothetical protein